MIRRALLASVMLAALVGCGDDDAYDPTEDCQRMFAAGVAATARGDQPGNGVNDDVDAAIEFLDRYCV